MKAIEEYIKDFERELKNDPEMQEVLKQWENKIELREDLVFELRLVIRSKNASNKHKTVKIAKALSEDAWNYIFSLTRWTNLEKLMLENFKKYQAKNYLWIYPPDIFEGEKAMPSRPWPDIDRIKRKLKKNNSPYQIRKHGGWGIVEVAPL